LEVGSQLPDLVVSTDELLRLLELKSLKESQDVFVPEGAVNVIEKQRRRGYVDVE
jgi:hypothetical protein